jgi:hypothetical protein
MFSWILTHATEIIPAWFWPLLIVISLIICLIFLKLLPDTLNIQSKFLILSTCFIVLFLSTFMFGGATAMNVYNEYINDMKNKIKIEKEKSRSVNGEVQTVVKYKTLIITKYKESISKKIESNKVEINASCKLSDSAINLYNQSVMGDQYGIDK